MNFNNLIVFASAVGIPLGLIKYISIWEKEGQWEEIRLIVSQFNTLLLIIGLIITVINIFFARDISYFLLGDEKYYLLIIYLSVSIPLSLVNPIFDSVLKGLKRFGHYVKITIFISVFSLVMSLILVYFYKVEGVIISLTFSSIIAFVAYYVYFHRTKLIKATQLISLNFRYSDNFKIVIKLGLASLFVGFADQLSQLFVRSVIIKTFGIESNGIYQSIYAISLNYFSVLFMSLGIYLLPVLSELRNKDLVNLEINTTLKLTFIVIVPLITTMFIFRSYIILLFYSKDFLPSTNLLFFNFLGDYFKAFSWIIGAWLIPLSKIKEWVTFSLIYYFNFLAIFYILVNYFDFGLKSVVVSYLISYVIHTIINLVFIIKSNDFKFSKINMRLFPLSILFILSLLLISNYNVIYGYIFILPCVLLWFKLSVNKEEFGKAFNFVKMKMLNLKN